MHLKWFGGTEFYGPSMQAKSVRIAVRMRATGHDQAAIEVGNL